MKYSLFSYKSGNSFLHRMPAAVKILVVPAVNILFLSLPPEFAAVFFIVQLILSCLLKFTFREQFSDLIPVLYYAVLFYAFSVISGLFPGQASGVGSAGFWETVKTAFLTAFLNKETFFMLLKLLCVMQSAGLVYKTSTSLELREGIGKLEGAVRRFFHVNPKLKFTNTISLFVNFIPLVVKIWEQLKKAWKARGGKKGLKMYVVLLPVLFSTGLKSAYSSAKAIAARE